MCHRMEDQVIGIRSAFYLTTCAAIRFSCSHANVDHPVLTMPKQSGTPSNIIFTLRAPKNPKCKLYDCLRVDKRSAPSTLGMMDLHKAAQVAMSACMLYLEQHCLPAQCSYSTVFAERTRITTTMGDSESSAAQSVPCSLQWLTNLLLFLLLRVTPESHQNSSHVCLASRRYLLAFQCRPLLLNRFQTC